MDCRKFSLLLPKFEMYETGGQLRRASKSPTANVVEGYGRRRYKAEYIRFVIFAHVSVEDSIEWLEYIRDLYPNLADRAGELIDDADKLGAKLNRFIRSIKKNHRTDPNVGFVGPAQPTTQIAHPASHISLFRSQVSSLRRVV